MRATCFLMMASACVWHGYANADTVHFKDGSALHGKASQPNADTVVLDVDSGRMTFKAGDVTKIETNDKTADNATLSAIAAKKHVDMQQERTGLTEEQRYAVRAALDPLWSADEAARNAARKKLVEMSKQMNVFQFIEVSLPYTKPIVMPEMMKALHDIDPEKTASIVSDYTRHEDPGVRGQALELMGASGKPEDVRTIARGLVDLEPSVRIAAAHAIAESGAKQATPALIEAMKSPNPQVQNAARKALSSLWSTKKMEAGFAKPDEWESFWSTQAGSVQDPFNPAELEPLVNTADLTNTTVSHDE